MSRYPSAWQSGLDASREASREDRRKEREQLKPLEPLLPGETRSEYLARVDADENAAWSDWFGRAQPFDGVEEAFRAGFRAAKRQPYLTVTTDDLIPLFRDAASVNMTEEAVERQAKRFADAVLSMFDVRPFD